MSRIMMVVKGADMRCRHEGLLFQAIKRGVKREELRRGNLIVFLNKNRNYLALLGFRDDEDRFGVLSTYKSPKGGVIPMESIDYIPEMYDSQGFRMDSAIRSALVDLLGKKNRRDS